MRPLIVLLTDFGLSDPYVGIMKGVLSRISPNAAIVDISHKVPPGDVKRAAFILWQSIAYFPKRTIFLVVIDPGVGTKRNPIIIEANDQLFVGPDNGVFSYILRDKFRTWKINNPKYMLPKTSFTFHGRDIFAPASAHLANGVKRNQFGPSLKHIVRLPDPVLTSPFPGEIQGEILHADRFGNVLTSIGTFHSFSGNEFSFRPWIGDLRERLVNRRDIYLKFVDETCLPIVNTFAEVPDVQCAGLIGSSGMLEIVANKRSAKDILTFRRGDFVSLIISPSR